MGVSVFSEYSSEIVTTVRKQQLNNNSKEESINMGYLSFAVVISVASFTLFGTTLNEASAEPLLARWNDNVAVDLGLEKRSDVIFVTKTEVAFKEHANFACPKTYGRRNTVGGTSAGCAKDPKCPGYSVSGPYARRCKQTLKFGDGSDNAATGRQNMAENPGKKGFIKEHCADELKNQDEEDIDCGGEACEPCALKNSCGKQPSCKENGAAPDCPDKTAEVCKCGSADGCMVATADTAPVCVSGTCKCSADQDSCSGNLLAPNCNAEAPQDPNDDSNTKKGVCECAPGEGACPDGTLCVDKKCKCGDIPACKDAKAPTCDFANSQCMCGTGPGCADMTNADKCDVANNKCVCGTTGDACDQTSDKPICKEGACAAKE